MAGTVVDVYMPADRATGKPRGFAFIEFASQAEAEAAVSQLNGRDLGGRALKANLAEDRPPRRPGGPRPFAGPRPAGGGRSFDGPRESLDGPSFFAVEGRFSRP